MHAPFPRQNPVWYMKLRIQSLTQLPVAFTIETTHGCQMAGIVTLFNEQRQGTLLSTMSAAQ